MPGTATVEQGWLVGSSQEVLDWEKTRKRFVHVMGFVTYICIFNALVFYLSNRFVHVTGSVSSEPYIYPILLYDISAGDDLGREKQTSGRTRSSSMITTPMIPQLM